MTWRAGRRGRARHWTIQCARDAMLGATLLEGQPATVHAAAAAADGRAATTSREAALAARVAALEAQLTAAGIVPTTTVLALSQA